MFFVFTLAAWAIQATTGELASLDDYRHARYAAELFANDFHVFGHPFLPLTLVGQHRADLWLGFHELLALFLRADDTLLPRAKLLAALCAACAPTALYVVLRRRAVEFPSLWAAFAVVCCPAWAFRDLMLRPAGMALALGLLVFQWSNEGRWRLPMVWGALYAWLHVSAPVSVALALLGALSAPRGASKFSRFIPVLATGAGLAIGLLTRPDAMEYLNLAWVQGTVPFSGHVPHIGQELRAPALSDLLLHESIPFVLGMLMLWPALRAKRWSEAAFFSIAFIASLFVRRFADFLLPASMILAAPALSVPQFSKRVAIALGLSLVPLGAYTASLTRDSFEENVREVEPAAALLAAKPGLVLNTNCFDFPMYYFHAPSVPFVCGYDPSFLAVQNPKAFWVWEHVRREGRYCETRECDAPASVESVERAMDFLGARWLALGNAERDATLLNLLSDSGPGLVKRYNGDTPDDVVLFERVR